MTVCMYADELVKLVQWIGMQVLMFGGQIAKLHKGKSV